MNTTVTADISKHMIGKVNGLTVPMRPSVEDTFLAAFEEYADALFRHARLRISDRERALDLVQDTFYKTWDYLYGGNTIKNVRAFLYRVLNNLIIDTYRHKKEVSLDALLEENSTALSEKLSIEGRQEKEERLDQTFMVEKIHRTIKELSEPYKIAISLRYIDGFTPKEIAKMLDISENVVSVRIYRALTYLRKTCMQNKKTYEGH